MLTNKYLREINAKFYLCKKMNDGSDKSDITLIPQHYYKIFFLST